MPILTDDEHTSLLEAVDLHRQNLRPLVTELMVDERRLSGDEGNALREAVGTELARSGFREDYEPNERGLALEGLIEKLGRVTAVFN